MPGGRNVFKEEVCLFRSQQVHDLSELNELLERFLQVLKRNNLIFEFMSQRCDVSGISEQRMVCSQAMEG
jgi:hypothetical protein